VGPSYGCAPAGSLSRRRQSPRLGRRILELPSWAVIMLGRRQADDVSEDDLARQVFPAPVAGGVRDPSNTLKMMR